MPVASLPAIRAISYPSAATPGEQTAAIEFARLTGATAGASPTPGAGVNLALAHRGWVPSNQLPAMVSSASAWTWLRLADDGTGEIIATHGSFLFAAGRVLANGVAAFTR